MHYHVTSAIPLLSLAVSLVSGCFNPGNHVQLRSPPAPTAPLAERQAAYEELRPHAQVDTVLIRNGQQIAQQPKFIMLRDGRRVYRAEDLAAVVPAQSPTAQAGQRSKRAGQRIRNWQIAGYTIAGVGLATSLITSATFPDPGDDGFNTHLGIASAGVLIAGVGVAVAVFGALANGNEFTDERATAFTLYDEDLRKGLELCVAGTSIVACPPAGTAPAAPAPAAPAPAPATPAPDAPAPAAPAAP